MSQINNKIILIAFSYFFFFIPKVIVLLIINAINDIYIATVILSATSKKSG